MPLFSENESAAGGFLNNTTNQADTPAKKGVSTFLDNYDHFALWGSSGCYIIVSV